MTLYFGNREFHIKKSYSVAELSIDEQIDDILIEIHDEIQRYADFLINIKK